jgi:hypothetical protein
MGVLRGDFDIILFSLVDDEDSIFSVLAIPDSSSKEFEACICCCRRRIPSTGILLD